MLNPIETSKSIKNSYVDYLATQMSIADPYYRRLFKEALASQGQIDKGPFIDISGSYESSKSLRELVKLGLVSEHFETLESVNEEDKELKYDRPLYSHQEESIRLTNQGESLIVSTGTGSGKTECFLIPIVQALLEERENGSLTDAVRAIIIYPMNALANDQMQRLRKLLASARDITFGLYNSSTKHTQSEALADYRELYGTKPLPNEHVSRESMQSNPPHILITNYSMLEHMMLRPKDDAVFSGAKLRYIVLDEAHIYRGATGIEMSLLMRRLRARISDKDKVRYILTSATLGDEDSDNSILDFASNLCGASFNKNCIVRSKEVEQPMKDSLLFPLEMFKELATSHEPLKVLQKYDAVFTNEGDLREKYFELLLRSELFANLRKHTHSTQPVSGLASLLGISLEDLVYFISICAKAVKNGTTLIKVRYHYFLRALEGAYVTLTGAKQLYLTRKEFDAEENRVFEIGVCRDCGRMMLAGCTNFDTLEHSNHDYETDTEFYLIKQSNNDNFFIDDELEEEDELADGGTDELDFTMCMKCGAIELEAVAEHKDPCTHDPSLYVSLRKAVLRKDGTSKCPACSHGKASKFYVGTEAATSVLGIALFELLPEYETTLQESHSEDDTEGFFKNIFEHQPKTTSRARQFLAFSDSRADAAFFASYMSLSYNEFLRRRGLWQLVDQLIKEGETRQSVSAMANRLARIFEKHESFIDIDRDDPDSYSLICRYQAYVAIMNELVSSKRSSGLVQLGKFAFEYAPRNESKHEAWTSAIGVTEKYLSLADGQQPSMVAKSLLNLLILDVVYQDALDANGAVELNAEEREYIFYSPYPKKITKRKESGAKGYLSGWIPRKRNGQKRTYYYSTRMERIKRAFGWEDEVERAWRFLSQLWENVLGFENEKEYSLNIQNFDFVFYRPNIDGTNLRFYECNVCGQTTPHNIQGHCVNMRCNGRLIDFDPYLEHESNHFAKLYGSNNLGPFYIKEHTAQLSRERGAEYQKLFVDKKINALSSSTTFEMGVDVGSLETVFLRNVPPTPANYVQRAGRAGRSIESAAYALTFARLNSHDFTYFDNPKRMIDGQIQAPIFSLENKKIVQRHINAIALSEFFRLHEEFYDGNNRSEFLNNGGYESFKEYLAKKPARLKDLLYLSLPDQGGNFGVQDWKWTDNLIGERGTLEVAVNSFNQTIEFLINERNRCRQNKDDYGASQAANKLRNFRADKVKDARDGRIPRRNLIDFLVRNNVLPKYGFPVDTVELLSGVTQQFDPKRPQMQRDLQLAVAEYAPGSEVVADGSIYKSRYINKTPGKSSGNWEYGWFAQCPNKDCGEENYYSDDRFSRTEPCRVCGQNIGRRRWEKSIEPRRGFVVEGEPVKARMRKPEKHYKTDDLYVGDPTVDRLIQRSFNTNEEVLQIESTTNDSLVVRTQTKFEVCIVCGYAAGKSESYKLTHKNSLGQNCSNESEPRELFLSHEFKTDVARITFETTDARDYEVMLSVLYALLEAMSHELDIERNDIKGCLHRRRLSNGMFVNNIVIYDAVAGGAGHSRRLATLDGDVLSRIIRRAIKLMDQCDCEPSCYKCLRNYYNKKIHDKLSRTSAADFLRTYQGDLIPILEETEDSDGEGKTEECRLIIEESTPLIEDYPTWEDASLLFTKYISQLNLLTKHQIPVADSFAIQIRLDQENIDGLLLWQDQKVIIVDDLSQQSCFDAILDFGWHIMPITELDIETLKVLLGVN